MVYKMAADEDRLSNVGTLDELLPGAMKTVDKIRGSVLKFRALRLLFKYYLKGDCPEGRPQPTKAVYYLTRTAELGDTEAQLELGQIYLHGGCEQLGDVAKARRWLQKASAHGDVRAKQVGVMVTFAFGIIGEWVTSDKHNSLSNSQMKELKAVHHRYQGIDIKSGALAREACAVEHHG